MTTNIVPSISDEILSELEWAVQEYPGDLRAFINHEHLAGLIARLRHSEKDAARYRWLRDHGRQPIAVRNHDSHLYHESMDKAIDIAMERQP